MEDSKFQGALMLHTCSVCDSTSIQKVYRCSEKMFGWGGEFIYFQCGTCGCLQIAEIPDDLEKYYPTNYYSFKVPPADTQGWRNKLAGLRDRYTVTRRGIAGPLLNRIYPTTDIHITSNIPPLGRIPLRLDSSILDVGCGNGFMLTVLKRAGFKSLQGIDPFMAADSEPMPGLHLRKQSLDQVEKTFDVIVLNHVFEHVCDGLQTLEQCRERLNPGGTVLLRFPTADSAAWERYRENWAQLDCPRHLFLHTRKSFELLADRARLRVDQWYCDSNGFQFWASELYRRGISLFDGQKRPICAGQYFKPDEMAAFEREANDLNRRGRGDQVVAILKADPQPMLKGRAKLKAETLKADG